MKESTNQEIIKALEIFGVKGKVEMRHINPGRIEVIVNGEYFGIWDVSRKTFVD